MLQLLHLGKEYPLGADYFKKRLKGAFLKHKDLKDEKEIEILIARGNYVVKELEALYMLRKYRTLKKRYYNTDPPASWVCDICDRRRLQKCHDLCHN